MPWVSGPWSDYPWWKKCAVWCWWKPRLLWRWPLAIGNPLRDHDTDELLAHLNWRGAWLEQSAIIELRMGTCEEYVDDDA